jgi:hypothetical protein
MNSGSDDIKIVRLMLRWGGRPPVEPSTQPRRYHSLPRLPGLHLDLSSLGAYQPFAVHCLTHSHQNASFFSVTILSLLASPTLAVRAAIGPTSAIFVTYVELA